MTEEDNKRCGSKYNYLYSKFFLYKGFFLMKRTIALQQI